MLVVLVDLWVVQPYQMDELYRTNIAKCKPGHAFVYKGSKGDMLLASFCAVPVGVFAGLFFRWRARRGWSYPISEPSGKTGKLKYKTLKALLQILAAILTTTPGFIYSVVVSIWIESLPSGAVLVLAWIMPCLINGFLFTCGM